jgi:hypothetical protein
VTNEESVSIGFPIDCWQFIAEVRSWATPVPLPADVQGAFDRTPRIEIMGAIPEPRLLVTLTRTQAYALQRWLHAMHDGLKQDDRRRLVCLMSISRVAVAIMLADR